MSQMQILISAATLHEVLSEQQWSIVDCRFDLADTQAGRRMYTEGHIPGAVFLDLDRDLAGAPGPETGRHPLPDVTAITARLGELGIGNSDTVVVYDGANGSLAARAWWILRWLGHKRVLLLDGGYAQWRTQGLPVESGEVRRPAKSFVATSDDSLVLTSDELAADTDRIRAKNLLDARDRPRFRGEQEPIDPVAGHIPGSVNLPFAEFVHSDGTWRPLASRRALLEDVLGTEREVAWSVMCGSGVTACHLAISGLEAGFSEPRLYVGSWSEWIQDTDRPISAGEA